MKKETPKHMSSSSHDTIFGKNKHQQPKTQGEHLMAAKLGSILNAAGKQKDHEEE